MKIKISGVCLKNLILNFNKTIINKFILKIIIINNLKKIKLYINSIILF